MDWRSFLTAVFCETLACLAQEDFDLDQMEDPLDLESLTEGSKRSPQHQSNVKALEEEASYGEQTIMALQQLGLVLGCKGLSSNVVHEKNALKFQLSLLASTIIIIGHQAVWPTIT